MKHQRIFWFIAAGGILVLLLIIFYLVSLGSSSRTDTVSSTTPSSEQSNTSTDTDTGAKKDIRRNTNYSIAGASYFNIKLPAEFYSTQRINNDEIATYILADTEELRPYDLNIIILAERFPQSDKLEYQLEYYRSLNYKESQKTVLGNNASVFYSKTISPNNQNKLTPTQSTVVLFSREGQIWQIAYSYLADKQIPDIDSLVWDIINSIEFKI